MNQKPYWLFFQKAKPVICSTPKSCFNSKYVNTTEKLARFIVFSTFWNTQSLCINIFPVCLSLQCRFWWKCDVQDSCCSSRSVTLPPHGAHGCVCEWETQRTCECVFVTALVLTGPGRLKMSFSMMWSVPEWCLVSVLTHMHTHAQGILILACPFLPSYTLTWL